MPRDSSVIGLDDIEMAAQSFPALSTVALPRYDIGRLAAELIFELMAEGASSSPTRDVATLYVARESVAAHVSTVNETHGTGEVSLLDHGDKPFTVAGVLAKTGTPVDRSVYVSLEGIEVPHWAKVRRDLFVLSHACRTP